MLPARGRGVFPLPDGFRESAGIARVRELELGRARREATDGLGFGEAAVLFKGIDEGDDGRGEGEDEDPYHSIARPAASALRFAIAKVRAGASFRTTWNDRSSMTLWPSRMSRA